MFMNSKFSMQVFGIYLILVAGCGLILIPRFMLDLFGLNAGDDVWIRMVGLLAALIGVYYQVAATADLKVIYRTSIPARIVAACFMAYLFASGALTVGILIFAALDLAGAIWTWAALRSED